MKYLLVLQFPETEKLGFDQLVRLEDLLYENLTTAEVDGHDIGSGQMNIFLFTNDPNSTFKDIKNLLMTEGEIFQYMKAAYRDVEQEEYILLWPKDLDEFNII